MGGIGLAGLIFYYALDMPDTDGLWSVSRSPEVRLYARDDTPLSQRGRNTGAPLRYGDLPPDLVQAVIAIEDRRFFSHYGLTRADWRAPCSPICGPDALCRAGRR